jgi:hypothetical protein
MASLGNAGIILVMIMQAVGLGVGALIFGANWILLIHTALVVAALVLKGYSPTAILVFGNMALGLNFAALLYGSFLYWVIALSGVGAIALIVLHFTQRRVESIPTGDI